MTTAKFIPLKTQTARALAAFTNVRNIGKTVAIEGKTYTLDYISHNTNAFFKSRGLSVYYRVGRSVVRLSDHWGASEGYNRSRKLNCGSISGKSWIMVGKADKIFVPYRAGRFPFECLAGVCGLSVLNKTCEHWLD